MKNRRQLYFLFAPIATFVIASLLFVKFVTSVTRSVQVAKSEIYLIGLRDETTVGCSNLDGTDLDYLVIGDSHTYSSFDFVTFTRLVQTQKIGVCTLGGFYFESMLMLLQSAEPTFINTKTVIYGLSYRQFTGGDNKEKQLEAHEKVISAIAEQSQPNFILLNARVTDFLSQNKSTKRLHDYRESLLKWTPIIQNLDEQKATRLFTEIQNDNSKSWQRYLQVAQLNPRFNEMAQQFCDFVTKHDLNLILVDIPESPHLSRLYSIQQKQQYDQVKAELQKCAKRFFAKDNFTEANQNKYFVNRFLTDDWIDGYATWNFKSEKQINNLYDSDHLNLIGAQVFTHKMVSLLNSQLENH